MSSPRCTTSCTGACSTNAGAIGRSKVAGKVLTDDESGGALSYTLSLVEARW